MLVYRICKNSYADDLSGQGAKLHGGRWNSKGISMLYTSSSRALAALEVLVHIPAFIPLKDFILVTIELPENSMEEIRYKEIKTEIDMKGMGSAFHATGDEWVKKNRSLVLKVPSLVIPDEYNYLVNPNHSLFSKLKINSKKEFSFDPRLLKK